MSKFSKDELKQRAFDRIAWVLKHFYDEQAEEFKAKGEARVHTRVFETLIPDAYVEIGKRKADITYREHLVPCAYIRDRAFKMYQEGSTVNDVASR
jgi:hypothetical protein